MQTSPIPLLHAEKGLEAKEKGVLQCNFDQSTKRHRGIIIFPGVLFINPKLSSLWMK